MVVKRSSQKKVLKAKNKVNKIIQKGKGALKKATRKVASKATTQAKGLRKSVQKGKRALTKISGKGGRQAPSKAKGSKKIIQKSKRALSKITNTNKKTGRNSSSRNHKAAQNPTLKKIKAFSKKLKNEMMILLEEGIKKSEEGLSYLETEIHKLNVKQRKRRKKRAVSKSKK